MTVSLTDPCYGVVRQEETSFFDVIFSFFHSPKLNVALCFGSSPLAERRYKDLA